MAPLPAWVTERGGGLQAGQASSPRYTSTDTQVDTVYQPHA